MKLYITIVLALAACTVSPPSATDHEVVSKPPPSTSDTLWYCYSHAACGSAADNELHELCARAAPEDVLIAGDAAARDWEIAWDATCEVSQGIVDGSLQLCEALFTCRAECFPQFEDCTP